MTEESIVLDVSPEGVAVVLLNRPAKRNAISNEMVAALQEAFETLKGADNVRVVFFKGAGGNFSSGFDLDTLAAQAGHDRAFNEIDATAMVKMLAALRELPQLTAALAEGHVSGAAMGIVAAADWVVASEGAQFRLAAARLGLNPATLIPFLIEAIGPRHARGILMSTAPLNAETARSIGLVHEVATDDEGLQSAMARLSNFALETAPAAARNIKATVQYAANHKFDDGLLREMAKRDAESRVSPSGVEGVKAFLGKRPAIWPID